MSNISDVQINTSGQPVGEALPQWTPRPRPTSPLLVGRYCRLEQLAGHHAEQLFAADQRDVHGESWTYMPYGPFADLPSYRSWLQEVCARDDPRFYAIIDTDSSTGETGGANAVGVVSYLRIQPDAGSIEVGHVHYSPLLQRHRAATEVQFLMMSHAFEDLGYRRYEWKCDALNAPSRFAAERLGFSYEGTSRQATVVKGRNRDTAWYSVIDTEWSGVRDRFKVWLDPDNFDDQARQRAPLRGMTSPNSRSLSAED